MSKSNYVYVAKICEVTNYGAMWDNIRIFGDLTSFLDWMELKDLVFIDKDQIERLKHGDEAAFKSNKNVKHKFVVGMVETEKFY